MKLVQINAYCGIGSTGKIVTCVSKLLNDYKVENYILFNNITNGQKNGIQCGGYCYTKFQALKSRVLGNYGFNSDCATKKMIAHMECIKPDIVHLHNIHDHDCNLTMLFDYLKSRPIKVYWTFHDCWAFTAYCPYFTLVDCDKWRSSCFDCPVANQFSWFMDNSASIFEKKKKLLEGFDMTIVTPSQWLARLVKQSFLKDNPVVVINNGIDLNIFKPTDSRFREKYGISPDKFILLGVAFGWGKRKGLDVFLELAKRLDKERYQIVLVGTDDSVDRLLSKDVISIHRTQNQTELAEIYTAADLFVNPTREENYPTVNMEAIACGTPVLTFDTGGSPEIITKETGSVVSCDDIDALQREIERICETRCFKTDACLEHAKKFDMNDRFKEYVDLYLGERKNKMQGQEV